ncbi:cellulose biosynthesis cyclic di-GMP-binding regulatory protein BcsB [Secundilactobacillus paracollinoides]|uniref:cellulose biosynthesis cyclic di-GMP-binding regulatory protein BcsB n=1 Tax=Secundilactobacillus paracollinoides TaxID=240427 RepID=UPI001CDB4236|nr:cellulose biosynthesis cyclic di-GMP-binding regulatory protein BcsB [Secundilactobacillus paracollinoides]
MNKSFINKQNGIKPNVISSGLVVLGLLVVVISALVIPRDVKAASTQTYTDQFQNATTTLSGTSVTASMYFSKESYWDVKNAMFNLVYQASQLTNQQTSSITVAVNGVKIVSFRPKTGTGTQTKAISIPTKLLSADNQLTVSGQIETQKKGQAAQVTQTPANWLTITDAANVTFQYQLTQAKNTVASFYSHYIGDDTVNQQHDYLVTADQPSSAELTASMLALSGTSRPISTQTNQVQFENWSNLKTANGDYVMVVATYNHLPAVLKRTISKNKIAHHAVIQTMTTKGQHYLIVTAKNAKLLTRAGRFVANQALMTESQQPTVMVAGNTNTATAAGHLNAEQYSLTDKAVQFSGTGHHESSYYVSLPNDRTNADGSTITLNMRYSDNLDFKRSLVTVSVNDTVTGSHRLVLGHLNGDRLEFNVPRGTALGSSFVVTVAMDLAVKDATQTTDGDTPWAVIEPSSKMKVKSQKSNDLLLTNYPTLFMKNETFHQLAVIVPKTLTASDYQTLGNLFNLMGSYAKFNTGSLTFYHHPSQKVLKESNVIAIGTPRQNPLIKRLNPKLYFKYNQADTHFVSNEKLSLTPQYGHTIGTDQLLRSPYNAKRGLLVVTGATPEATYLASTQLNTASTIQQYTGDAILVDTDNQHMGYRFKKNKAIDESLTVKRNLNDNMQLLLYLGAALVVIAVIGVAIILVLKKQGLLKRGGQTNDK